MWIFCYVKIILYIYVNFWYNSFTKIPQVVRVRVARGAAIVKVNEPPPIDRKKQLTSGDRYPIMSGHWLTGVTHAHTNSTIFICCAGGGVSFYHGGHWRIFYYRRRHRSIACYWLGTNNNCLVYDYVTVYDYERFRQMRMILIWKLPFSLHYSALTFRAGWPRI